MTSGGLGGSELQLSPANPFTPVLLPLFGQGVDRVVIRVLARQRLGVVVLDTRAVVLRPGRDAAHPVVLGPLVHPALADESHVADDSRRGESWQVAHDRVLQVNRL